MYHKMFLIQHVISNLDTTDKILVHETFKKFILIQFHYYSHIFGS